MRYFTSNRSLLSLIMVMVISCFCSEKTYARGTDTIPPTLKLIGPSHDSIPVLSSYHDLGYTVTDNYYPNVSVTISGTFIAKFKNNFANKLGTYTLIYTAVDSSGNKANVTRYIKVYDNVTPLNMIRLIGSVSANVCRFSVYKDPGYTIDTPPGYSSIKVDTIGSFLKSGTSYPGFFQLTYVAKDTFGNSASVSRMISVEPAGNNGCTASIANAANSLNGITLFPNPASQNIYLDPGNQTITDIRIMNELGMLVFDKHNADTGIQQIPISGYKSGIYMVSISSENGIVVKRFLKY